VDYYLYFWFFAFSSRVKGCTFILGYIWGCQSRPL